MKNFQTVVIIALLLALVYQRRPEPEQPQPLEIALRAFDVSAKDEPEEDEEQELIRSRERVKEESTKIGERFEAEAIRRQMSWPVPVVTIHHYSTPFAAFQQTEHRLWRQLDWATNWLDTLTERHATLAPPIDWSDTAQLYQQAIQDYPLPAEDFSD